MENQTENGAGEIIKNYMRELQKKSAKKRLENDPNTYKKMRAIRTEKDKEGDLEIRVE